MDKTLGRCGWNYQIIWLHQHAWGVCLYVIVMYDI
jgi:hypothetical protein